MCFISTHGQTILDGGRQIEASEHLSWNNNNSCWTVCRCNKPAGGLADVWHFTTAAAAADR